MRTTSAKGPEPVLSKPPRRRSLLTLPPIKLTNVLSVVLVILLFVRIVLVIGSVPIVGYANNYDFVRQSACVGVWENYPDGRPKTAASPEQPVDALLYDGQRLPDVCLPSSDNIFPWAVAHLHREHTPLALHEIGWLKAATAAALLLAILSQPVPGSFRFGVALAALLIFGDFAFLCYFNTLYLEGSVIIFGFAAIALTGTLFCNRMPPSPGFVLLLATVLIWFVFARLQYAAFALLLAGLASGGFFLRWQSPIGATALLVASAACVGGIAYLNAHQNEHTANTARANIADTVLGAVLPAASDKPAALRQLGLPPHCANAIGMNWYTPGFQQHPPCSEVYNVRRLQLLPLFIHDPMTFLGPFSQAVLLTRPAVMPDVSHFERAEDNRRAKFRLLSATSFTTLLELLPQRIYKITVLLSVLLAPLCLVAFLVLRVRMTREAEHEANGALLLAVLGGGLTLYGLLSSVFGDGYFELQRHALGVQMGIALQIGATAAWVAARLEDFESGRVGPANDDVDWAAV